MSTSTTLTIPLPQEEARSQVLRLALDVEQGPITRLHEASSPDGGGEPHPRGGKSWVPSGERIKQFVIANFLPLGFLFALAFALAWPQPGCLHGETSIWCHGSSEVTFFDQIGSIRAIQALNNILVFLISGLTLKSNDLKQALKNWVGVLYGIVAILVLTPCVGFVTQQIPFKPKEFTAGLSIFCTVPTTLGVGVALVSAAKGNQALALFLTVATNVLGIVSVPYELKLILRGSSSVSIDALDLFVKLICTVLVPTIIGKLASSSSARIRSFVQAHKVALSLFSTSNLVLIVWQTLSGARDILLKQSAGDVLLIVLAVMGLHIFYLAFNVMAVWLLRLPLVEAIAVVIMSSQKSAPVAVTVITYVTPDIAVQGLLSIPGLIGQLFQIFLGSVIAKVLAKKVDKEQQD